MERGGIALALGGGGARGLAHVGVLQVLEESSIPIRAIAGTSMGGLLGALYASGTSSAELQEQVDRFANPREVLKLVDVGFSTSGLSIKGARLYELLAEQLGGDLGFEDLRCPLAVLAVDLASGREVVLREGSVADAVRATVSVAGVFEPVERDGMRLVDGGLLNNLPVDVAAGLAPLPVVAVDVIPPFGQNEAGREVIWSPLEAPRIPRFINEASHVRLVMIARITEQRLREAPPALLLRPIIPTDITVLAGFHRVEELVDAGRRVALGVLPQLRQLAGLTT